MPKIHIGALKINLLIYQNNIFPFSIMKHLEFNYLLLAKIEISHFDKMIVQY